MLGSIGAVGRVAEIRLLWKVGETAAGVLDECTGLGLGIKGGILYTGERAASQRYRLVSFRALSRPGAK